MKEHLVGTLNKASNIGYEGVEFVGYGGLSAKELYQIVGDLGLTAVSNPVPLTSIENTLDAVIESAMTISLVGLN